MVTIFSIFRLFNVIYQIFVTIFSYGLNLGVASIPALIREGIRCLFIVVLLFLGYKNFKQYRKKWKTPRITFISVIIFGVLLSYFVSDTSISNMFIGIKYGFRWTFILLSATWLGFIFSNKWKESKFIPYIPWCLVIIVLCGFLWQGAKLIRPNLFYSLGYVSPNDYAYGTNPPIYYLTGYEGTLRWQGLFSGPNNYGYFLVAFFPLIWRFFINRIKENKKTDLKYWLSIGSIALRLGAMVFTVSRAVLVGMIIVFIVMYRRLLLKHKKFMLRGGVGILAIFAIISVWKRESTLGHITSKLETIPAIISAPLGYGLGSSGPAVHYEGKYLPENYYFQIMLDIGTIGFLIWILSIMYLIKTQFVINKAIDGKLSNEEQYLSQYLHQIQIGFFALCVMGLFLHVFEDSMVNYLFFTIYGIILGSLSKNVKEKIGRSIKIKK